MKLEFSADTRMDLIEGETYVVTDPCYIFGDLCWNEFCEKIENDGNRLTHGSFTYGEVGPVLFSSTWGGDGEYDVRVGDDVIGSFGVDDDLDDDEDLDGVQSLSDILVDMKLAIDDPLRGV